MNEEVIMRLARLESEVAEINRWKRGVDTWCIDIDETTKAIADMVKLFRSIESGLWLFVKLGNALKWVVSVAVSVGGPAAALWYYIKEHSK